MTTPTDKDIPSNSVQDRLYNAEKFDEFMNSDNPNYTDRKGKSRWTLNGIRQVIQNWITQLSGIQGGENIGLSDGMTLQDKINLIEGKSSPTGGEDLSVHERTQTKGQYDLSPAPEDTQAAVGISFGGKLNLGSILLDSRGRLQTQVSVDNQITSKGIYMPFSEGTGYWRGPYQDVIARFPVDGQADDETSPGLMFVFDPATNTQKLLVVSPLQTGLVNYTDNDGWKWGWANATAVRELAQLDSIGRSLANSYDTLFTLDSVNANFVYFARITNPNPNPSIGARFSCIVNIGNATGGNVLTYLLDVNIPSTVTTLTQYDVNKYVRFTGIGSGKTLYPSDVRTSVHPSVGIVQDAANGIVDFYIRTPPHSYYFSSTCINSGNPALITWLWRNYAGGTQLTSLSGTTPAGIIYAPVGYTSSNYRTVILNDGSSYNVPEGYAVLRCHMGHAADGIINAAPFTKYVSAFCYATNFEAAVNNITCLIPSYNVTVTGCDLATDMPWCIRLPPNRTDVTGYRYEIVSTDTSAHTFVFRLKKVLFTGVNDSSTNTVTIAQSLSASGVDYGPASWVDVLVKLVS